MAGKESPVAVVTGGDKGLGRNYSIALAGAGYRVAVADIDAEAAAAAARDITSQGGEALPCPLDVTEWENVQDVFRQVWERYGRIDALVNNAALYAVLQKKPFYEIEGAEWDRVMAVNLRGMFNCCRAVFPYMKEQGGGRIVNVSSSTALKGSPYFLHYVTSKAGVIGLTRALAREAGEFGICVNVIAPGMTLSGTNDGGYTTEDLADRARQRCLKRNQLPEDLLGIVLFLCSGASDFITGQTFVVDGGAVMN